MSPFEKLLQPIKIGEMEVKNRFVMAPMVTNYAGRDGFVTERLRAYYRARAKGGVGLIIVEAAFVDPSGKGYSNELGIYKDDFIDGLKRLVHEVRRFGTKIAIQIYHSGRQSHGAMTGGRLIAPSPIPCPVCREAPKEMTKGDINNMIEAYGQAARRAVASGFDAVEMHGAHGYLINQFLSPYSNQRMDEYGGPLENRARFPLEVLGRVRKEVGEAFPIIYRMSSEEFVDGGLTVEDTMAFSVMLSDNGIDAIHVSGGVYESSAMIIQPAAVSQGLYVENASSIKEAIDSKVPVLVVGRIKDPEMAEDILAQGKADMVVMGRALLADPEMPAKVIEGRPQEIRPCIGCNQGCVDKLLADQDIACLGNALTGREWEFDLDRKASVPKRVLVIGGGPGGLECARVAAQRGHDVFLYEKGHELGGQMNIAAIPPHKGEIKELAGFLISQVKDLGVRVKVGEEVDETVIDKIKPDLVMLATGSLPINPDIPGVENNNVLSADEILAGASFGGNVVIVGGGMVGCETAEFLADKGAKVTIVEMLSHVATDMGLLTKALLIQRMKQKGIKIFTKKKVKEINSGGMILEEEGHTETIDHIDTIVLAMGYKSNMNLGKIVEEKGIPVYKIGDCLEPRNMMEAIHEGFLLAYEL
jgi:2,4-dienoyl-CoA reductase-like NADH-dependent reductase (Old Yellow Enzyme family)/NADPH-dependent glutamate synthase beta subunit-like oxidoreductase